MKICIAGKSYISVEALLHTFQIYGKSNVCICPNRDDKGIHNWQPSLKKIAKDYNIEIVDLDKLYDVNDLIFISLEFDRIIKVEKFKTDRLYNIHFSSLPAYKGVYTSAVPLLNNEKKTGVTLHKIDQGIDTGDIIDQINFGIDDNETAFSLYLKYNMHALKLFKENLVDIVNNNYKLVSQSAINSTYYGRSYLDYKNLSVDLNKTAYEINSQVRAYNFRAYQLAKIGNVPISHSVISSVKSTKLPNGVKKDKESFVLCSTIDFEIILFKDPKDKLINYILEDKKVEFKKIIDSGYNTTEKFENGWDLSIIAAYNGKWDILSYLLKNNLSIYSKNNNGTNILMYTISSKREEGKVDIIKKLIDLGLSPELTDYSGKSTLDYLIEYDRQDLVKEIENI